MSLPLWGGSAQGQQEKDTSLPCGVAVPLLPSLHEQLQAPQPHALGMQQSQPSPGCC